MILSYAFGADRGWWPTASPACFDPADIAERVCDGPAPQLVVLDQSSEDQLRHAGATPRAGAREDAWRLARVEEYMRANLSEAVSLGDLAAVVGRSVFQLTRMCRMHWGETPFSRLTRLPMERAQDLLRQDGHTVTEIAFECGYGNPSHFATAFRRHVGMSARRRRATGSIGEAAELGL